MPTSRCGRPFNSSNASAILPTRVQHRQPLSISWTPSMFDSFASSLSTVIRSGSSRIGPLRSPNSFLRRHILYPFGSCLINAIRVSHFTDKKPYREWWWSFHYQEILWIRCMAPTSTSLRIDAADIILCAVRHSKSSYHFRTPHNFPWEIFGSKVLQHDIIPHQN